MSKEFHRRFLKEQIWEYDVGQRENALYTRCYIKDKVCSVAIKGKTLANAVSDIVVEKLRLPLVEHTEQTSHKRSHGIFGKKVMVPIRLGTYEEEVLCVVIPLQSTHILLGAQWQVDHQVKFDEFRNKYSLMFGQKKVFLAPLPPHEVSKDQEYVQHQREERRQMEAEAQGAKDYVAKNNEELQKSVVEVNEQPQEDKDEEEEKEKEEEEEEEIPHMIPYSESILLSEVKPSVIIVASTVTPPIPTHIVKVIPTSMEPTKTLPYVLQDVVDLNTRVRAMEWKDKMNQEEWSRELPKMFKQRKRWVLFRQQKICILNLHVRGSKQDKLMSWLMKKYFGRDNDDLFRI